MHISSFLSANKKPHGTLSALPILLLFLAAFGTGSLAGYGSRLLRPAHAASETASWGLSYPEKGKRPVGNATPESLRTYNAYYTADTDRKILYLTFDCGYENGNMPAILSSLKKHHAKAAFFVVGSMVRDHGDVIRDILKDGHTIGNHTMTHPDMASISSLEAFHKELSGVEQLYKKTTGEDIAKFYRPPRGIYSTRNLSMAQKLGYHTFFWSLAYMDWKQDAQPTKEEAFDKLLSRVHPGAIVLLHSTSSTNARILDELLTRWEEMGYSFGTLSDLIAAS